MQKILVLGASVIVLAGCDMASMNADVAAPYSVDDFQRDYPGMGQAEFNRIDSDLDGNLSPSEIEAAQANGDI